MKSILRSTSLAFAMSAVLPAFGQAGPPPASSLEDITGCSLEGESVIVTSGRDASARRYKYPFDASVDALCNAKGFAIAAPPKVATPPAVTAPAPAAPAATVASPTGPQSSFPPGLKTPTAQEMSAVVSGKAFRSTFANGTTVRLKVEPEGGLTASAPGYFDSGRWKVEEGKFCGSLRKGGDFCNDARLTGSGSFYLRRNSGEIVRYDLD